MSRELLDSLPTGRSIFSMGQLVTGVSLNVPDVGGARAMQQTYMSTRGLTSANNIVQVEGLMINGLDGDGAVQQYINNAMVQEMSYQTAGAGADVSPGGIRVNIIPKDGGNGSTGRFRALERWRLASDNLTPAQGARPAFRDKMNTAYDFNVARAGNQARQLWFYGSAGSVGQLADCGHFYVRPARRRPACRRGRRLRHGVDDQKIKTPCSG